MVQESKFQSQMASQYSQMPYGSVMPSYVAPGSMMPTMAPSVTPSHYSASVAVRPVPPPSLTPLQTPPLPAVRPQMGRVPAS